MERRRFIHIVAGAMPAALTANTSTPPATARPPRVSSGSDRFSAPCRLADQSTIDRKVSASETGGQLLIIENHAAARFGPPRHVHHEQDEWFHVISGEVLIEIGDTRHRLLPGDSLLAPRGIPHVWAQVAPMGGRLLIAFQPAGKMEAFFAALSELGRMPVQDEARKLFEQHGMSLTGPPLGS